MKLFAFLLALLVPFAAIAGKPAEYYLTNVANLIDPVKLATLGKRKANERVQKVVALLENARQDGFSVSVIAENAVMLARYTNAWLAVATYNQLCKSHQTAGWFGVLTEAGLKDMRQGKSPTIPRGQSKGDELSVDYIIPYSIAPDLSNVIANLQLMPLKSNKRKNDTVGPRELILARQFREAGVLSDASCKRILKQQKKSQSSQQPLPQQFPVSK